MPIVFDSDAGTITGLSVGGLPDGIVDSGTLAADSVTAAKIAANSVDSSELVDGSIDNSHLAADAVDFVTIRNDISTLALHSAIADNKAAYNLPNSFIDQFQDDTGIGTETTGDRNTTSEYWGTVIPGFGTNSNTKILLHMDDTSLSDSSGTSTTTTVTGMTRSSAQSKFGGYSALSDGSEYITLANVPTWQSASTLFGIDFWWRPTSLTSSPAV